MFGKLALVECFVEQSQRDLLEEKEIWCGFETGEKAWLKWF